MDRDINNIHDKFVRASFMDTERAAAFFEQVLPETILSVIMLDTIDIIQESYITEELKEYFSDIVYHIKLKDSNEDELEVALLFEHKSYPDKNVAFQVGLYMFSHWVKCIREKKKLRPVIPVVYYQGSKEWKVPAIYERFVEYPKSILEYIPTINHMFIGLNTLSTSDIIKIKNGLMAAAVLAQKRRHDPIALVEDLQRIFELFPNDYGEGNFFEILLVYIVNVSEIEEKTLSKAIELIPDPLKNNIMTTYQKLIERGKREGREEGKKEGREEGREEGMGMSELKFILNGFDNGIDVKLLSNITNKPEEEIRKILIDNGKISA